MFSPFDQELARHYCHKTIDNLEKGYFELKQVTAISLERINQGVMIGCLVCWDSINKKRIILITNSGISKQIISKIPTSFVFVPPIVSNDLINLALQKNDIKIHELTNKINLITENSSTQLEFKSLSEERTKLTDESLRNVFSLYEFYKFDGKKISLNQIIKNHQNLPPTGTGDCCAPKLLSYAFKNNLIPISMDEIYFGNSTKNKIHKNSYGPCDERCGYILPEILGLEILYRDKDIVVVNKPSGLLSVPGRGEDKQDCVVSRLKKLFPECIQQPSVHRLDMETSGLLVLALTEEAHKKLSIQFEEGIVHKKYCALLDGVLATATGDMAPIGKQKSGTIELKFRLDINNRPHQIYDEINGKLGITDWELLGTEYFYNPITNSRKKVTRIIYTPKTGRTHQLRLASCDLHGFGLPILGDSLYGNCQEGERLMLHSFELEFEHPTSCEKLNFFSKIPF